MTSISRAFFVNFVLIRRDSSLISTAVLTQTTV